MEHLPLEIKRLVLSYLEPYDLWKCLHVCKSWRLAANDTILWRELLKREDIYYPENPAEDITTSEGSICKPAITWYEWTAGPVSKWKKHSSDCITWIERPFSEDIEPVYTSNKNTFAFYFNCSRDIILLFTKNGKQEIKVPTYSPNNTCPYIDMLKLNDKYLVASTVPFGCFIYRKQGNKYERYMSFLYSEGHMKRVEWTCLNFSSLTYHSFFILWDDLLIATQLQQTKFFIVDLIKGCAKRYDHSEAIVNILVSKKYLAVVDAISVSIYDKAGNLKYRVYNEEELSVRLSFQACLNEEILVLVHVRAIITYNVHTGMKLSRTESGLPVRNCILPEKGHIIYMRLEGRTSQSCRVIAQSVYESTPIWQRVINGVKRLQLICKKYLHVITVHNEWHLMDIKDGTSLHSEHGCILHVSDFFSLMRDSNCFFSDYFKKASCHINGYTIRSYYPKVSF